MDISYWTQYNPKLAIGPTLKKYYGRYLYKLVVHAPCGRLIDFKETIQDGLERRRKLLADNTGNLWYWNRLRGNIDQVNVAFLEKLKELRHEKYAGIKLRVEEPFVQIYADSEQKLKDLVQDHLHAFPADLVHGIYGPASAECEQVLNSGAIIRKNHNGYRYKMIIKDGKYSPTVKQALLDYVINVGPEVAHLPKSSMSMLKSPSVFVWNTYVFCNDIAVATFIDLMHPGMVLNIHELVIVDNK